MTDFLWIDRYAELLGCEARPGAVAAAIETLKGDVDRVRASVPVHRKAARDAVIREMRESAVNCNGSSECALAHRCSTGDEETDD